MITNLKTFEANFKENYLELKFKTTDMTEKDYPLYFIVSRVELPLLLDCIEGVSEFYPFLHDGSYLLKFHPQGLIHHYMNETTHKTTWVNFPFKHWSRFIDAIKSVIVLMPKESFTVSLTIPERETLSDLVKPNTKWVLEDHKDGKWIDFTYVETVVRDITKSLDRNKQTNPELSDMLEGLNRWAMNSSNGNLVEIHLRFDNWKSFDGVPDDYYFYLYSENKTLVNGGIIAHKREKDGNITYEYSTHT